jgi:hypothetical protein
MRRLFLGTLLLFTTGCGTMLHFDKSEMTPDQMLARATHIFVGVIEKQEIVSAWPILRIDGAPTDARPLWKILRRRVRVEMVLRGSEPRTQIDIYEIFWTGGTTGDWNNTHNGERDLFMVRKEGGEYHVVRDWSRSIFPIYSGQHARLPLDDSHSFWERYALMNWWVGPDWSWGMTLRPHRDPGGVLGIWRVNKLLRGLLRHPSHDLALATCEALLHGGYGQDECWDTLSADDRKMLERYYNVDSPEDAWRWNRHFEAIAHEAWDEWSKHPESEMDDLRLFTTMSNPRLRAEFCRLFQKQFPIDHDNGCPADRPPPATIVTEDGDVPLTGPWPQ